MKITFDSFIWFWSLDPILICLSILINFWFLFINYFICLKDFWSGNLTFDILILIEIFLNQHVWQKCLHKFFGLLIHKTLKDGVYIQNNFKRSYNMCVAIYFVWVLVHFCDPHAQSMLPNSIRLLEAPFQHLNLKQTRHGKLRLLAVLPSFPPSSFSRYLPWSRKILAMFHIN